jgi:putative addiction module component (TIGR02574 family)
MKAETIEELESALLHLPAADRSRLATRLIDSLEQEEESEISAEWVAEIENRARRLDVGETKPIPASVVWKQVNERFGTAY